MTTTIRALVGAIVLALPLHGCGVDEIIEVTDPDIVNPADLRSAAGAAAAYAGGIGDFAFAIVGDAGGTEGQVLVGGSITDELMNSETFPTRQEYENRAMNERNGTLTAVERNLHRARYSLEQAVALLEEFAPTPRRRVAEMLALAGLTYVFFGEQYCSGVPFSSPEEGLGTPKSTTEMFNMGITRFDEALGAFGPGDTLASDNAIKRLARVGKGRALLNRSQTDYAAAAAEVAGIPLSFRYQTTHTTTTGRQQNGVHVFNWITERFSVADQDGSGGTGLNYRSAGDPRVQVNLDPNDGKGFDAATPQWRLLKYPTRTSSFTVADGLEARLIIAEVALQAGNATAWLDTLNSLRANAATILPGYVLTALPALADPGAAGRLDLQFRERAFWLFLTGHRMGDLRRLMRQYGRAEDAVFPTGVSPKGVVYGDDVAIPVSFDERNNENFTGCSTTTP